MSRSPDPSPADGRSSTDELTLGDTEPAGADAAGKTRAQAAAVLGLTRTEPASDTATATATATSTATEDRHALRPGAVFAQYELIRKLGRGGMGVVYLARDTRLGRRVAIKFLAPERSNLAQAFLAEARATARCKHENILDIYEVGEARGYSFMVLEYVQGITLRTWIQQQFISDEHALLSISGVHRRGIPSRAVEIALSVVRALAHAHSMGLVHRDLKPENVMLADNGRIKVLDFGIALTLRQSSRPDEWQEWLDREFDTHLAGVMGTVPYMAPEQWGIDEIDARSDIWAMGLMLWEMCTGRHPLSPLSKERSLALRDLDVPMPLLSDMRSDLGRLGKLVDACLRKRKNERLGSASELLAALEEILRAQAGSRSDSGEPENPFNGLAAFQESDADRFFGRERDIAGMMTRLRHHRMVTVAGPSGTGKSSFVRAGLLPALQRSGQQWEAFVVRPGRWPMAALAGVLLDIGRAPSRADDGEQDASTHESAVTVLCSQPGFLGAALRTRCQQRKTRILLFVDQFEELYTLGADRDLRATFVACLEGVADDASSPLRVVLSLRSDFLYRVAEDRAFTDEITRGLLLLPGLGRDQLRDVLTRPLRDVGYRFESEELVTTMLESLEATRSPLPLLQFTASRLWDARDRERKLVTLDSYRQMGGVAGALATQADAVLAGLSLGEQQLARELFTCLVTEERTRAIVNLDELRSLHRDGDAVEQVVNHLAAARLVLIATDAEQGSTVELVHESLIDQWPRLGEWLAEDQDAAQFRVRVRAAAREWHKQGRTEDLLWRGRAAEEARRWQERWQERGDGAYRGQSVGAQVELGTRDRDFLQAVVERAARVRRRRRRRIVLVVAFLAAVAVVVSLLAVRANRAAERAAEQWARAEHQGALAARHAAEVERQAAEVARQAARATAESIQARNAGRMATAREQLADPTLVLALVREIEPGYPPKRWSELARYALQRGVARTVLSHPEAVFSASFSPDGGRIATGSFDRSARIWDLDGGGDPLVLSGHDDLIYTVAFSPDGTRLATASFDHTARIWSADGTGEAMILRGHLGVVYTVAFSPDGQRVVTASMDKTARIWNLDRTAEDVILRGHGDIVESASFSPDGRKVVTASMDKTARIWNADGSGRPLVLRGHENWIYTAVFSPDGRRIGTASLDKTARIWNADGKGAPVVLSGHGDKVYSIAFSPDGRQVVTASMDNTVRLWNADGRGRPRVLQGHQDRVYTARFSPDGRQVASASRDKTVRVWPVRDAHAPLVVRGHEDRLSSAAFSPGGDRIVTASRDGTARIWRADTGEPLQVLRGHRDWVSSALFDRRGERVVTASRDRSARVWWLDGTRSPTILQGHEDQLFSAAFSPDGRLVVTASRDRTARIFDLVSGGRPTMLAGHEGWVYSAAFSPDGRRVVTGSHDRTARIWDVDTGRQIRVLSGHRDWVSSAAFSPDGRHIVTASEDKTVRLWRADGTGDAMEFADHDSVVLAGAPGGVGAFSAEGRRIASISDDQTIRIWNRDGSAPPVILRAPEIDAYSVAFSPDGTRLVSTSHIERDAKDTIYSAWIWTDISPLSSLDDRKLWTATDFCLSIDQRRELLGVPEYVARSNRESCRRQVRDARGSDRGR